jgi:hypothetical protein
MTDPKRVLYKMAYMESLQNHQGYLKETIGSLVKLLKSMPKGKRRDRLLDEISKLDVITGGIKEALDVMEE